MKGFSNAIPTNASNTRLTKLHIDVVVRQYTLDDHLALLRDMPNLQSLTLFSCEKEQSLPCCALPLRPLVHKLRELAIGVGTDSQFWAIVFPALTSLLLCDIHLSSLDVPLSACPALTRLNIGRNVTADRWLPSKLHPLIRDVHLTELPTDMNDPKLLFQLLAKLPNVEFLTLPGYHDFAAAVARMAERTDGPLQHLRAISFVEQVLDPIPPGTLERLSTALPNCAVTSSCESM